MRLSINQGSARVGNVEIHDMFRVTELDAGHVTTTKQGNVLSESAVAFAFSQTSVHAIEKDLAIVVPCMNEARDILDGVLRGVPHDVLIILVSNSSEANFESESQLLETICHDTGRVSVVVHQQSSGLAQALLCAGMSALVEPNGPTYRVRNGKGEAMMIGTAFAKLSNKRFVGFIDADNLVAGSVHEYCKVYAAGLHYALYQTNTDNPYAMVRIKWNSKPKVRDNELVFEKSGRSSRVVNHWMNRLLNSLTDTGKQDIIQTANAGEHAMSVDLALQLHFASGYAVEPFQLVDAWERLAAQDRAVQILQIETRNPHFHDCGKGDGHIKRMQAGGLSTVYHSPLTPQNLKAELKEFCKESLADAVDVEGTPGKSTVYPPLRTMDFDVFREGLEARAGVVAAGGVVGSR
tara:strand:- start:288 stop:1508 length:1221 start_codon:yes stop_codon:yes gene_type:complete